MNSRERILEAVSNNQPSVSALPDISHFISPEEDCLEKFMNMLSLTGGKAVRVNDYEEIKTIIKADFSAAKRIVSTIPALSDIAEMKQVGEEEHLLANVDLAIVPAHFAVAENAAVWVTEDLVKERVLPFISQNLAAVIRVNDIVPTMHEAYERISNATYGFATFIAGPSKTADIEQSLVLGAHGPKSMMVFILPPAN